MMFRRGVWIFSALVVAAVLPSGQMAAAVRDKGALSGSCPAGYQVKAGLNTDFPSDGKMRAFVVVPPAKLNKPVPVWVALTGTVESTNDNLRVARSGANALLADDGFLVIGPVRECANQDPDLRAGVCNGAGIDGWNWRPWTEGRAGNASGDQFKADEGPDSRFLIAAVKCGGTIPVGFAPAVYRRHFLRRNDEQSGADVPIRLLGGRTADFWGVVRDSG